MECLFQSFFEFASDNMVYYTKDIKELRGKNNEHCICGM